MSKCFLYPKDYHIFVTNHTKISEYPLSLQIKIEIILQINEHPKREMLFAF